MHVFFFKFSVDVRDYKNDFVFGDVLVRRPFSVEKRGHDERKTKQ